VGVERAATNSVIEVAGAEGGVAQVDAVGSGTVGSGTVTGAALAAPPRPGSARPDPARIAPAHRSRADRFARWALRVRDPVDGQEVHNLFSASMALSGTRCLLSYIVLPVLAPWLGTLPFIGPAIGIPVGVVALVFDVRAMRRFFASDHRWRWVAAVVYLAVMAMVASLVFRDISRLI
jgi:hypothetical protein